MSTEVASDIRFRLPGRNLAAKVWGPANGKPVLALHGWLDNANSFDLLAPHLKGIRLVALDLAGHGLSDHRPAGASYYLWDHLEDVFEVVTMLGWKQFALLGHSMGAGIATWFAGAFPERVNQLALIDGFGAAFAVDAHRLPEHLSKAIRRRHLARKVSLDGFAHKEKAQFSSLEAALEDRMNGMFGRLSSVAAGIMLDRGLETVAGGYRWRYDPLAALPAMIEPDEAAICNFIDRITAPVLLILGDQGLYGQGQKAERLKHFRKLEVRTLSGGHHLHLEGVAPDVASLIQSFFIQTLALQFQNQ